MFAKRGILMTTTMRSHHGGSMVFVAATAAATGGAGAGLARIGAVPFLGGAGACCALAAPGLVTAKAALAAAPFRKFRRSTELDFVFFAIVGYLSIEALSPRERAGAKRRVRARMR